MEFMNEYKRLDNLCKDVFRSDAGVSRYIEAMNSYETTFTALMDGHYTSTI